MAGEMNDRKLPRELSDEERDKLRNDTKLVSEFRRGKLEKEAQKNWDCFYKRNTTKFFKDRHWTTREFQELVGGQSDVPGQKVILEVGCGVGNLVYPLLEEVPNLFIHACDFSPRAVQFVKDNPQYDPQKVNAFQCDLTKDSLLEHINKGSVDVVTMVFVLSAVHPDKMLAVLHNVFQVLKPGGLLYFRDYGLYDMAMLRFAPGHKLSDNFYVRQDGTRAYYFSTEHVEGLVHEVGYEVVSNEYVERRTVNKKEGIDVGRIFVQGKFRTPEVSIASMPDGDEDKYCSCMGGEVTGNGY